MSVEAKGATAGEKVEGRMDTEGTAAAAWAGAAMVVVVEMASVILETLVVVSGAAVEGGCMVMAA
jgi:hypothetical protein